MMEEDNRAAEIKGVSKLQGRQEAEYGKRKRSNSGKEGDKENHMLAE